MDGRSRRVLILKNRSHKSTMRMLLSCCLFGCTGMNVGTKSFLKEARLMRGFTKSFGVGKKRGDDRTFRTLFGVSPEVCVDLWHLCQFKKKGTRPKHILWALLFIKVYATEDVLCSMASVCRRTFRDWMWPTLKAIMKCKKKVVS